MKSNFAILLAFILSIGTLTMQANVVPDNGNQDATPANEVNTKPADEVEQEEYMPGTDAPEPAGFITELLNNSLGGVMEKQPEGKPRLGRTLKDYASAPKFGGYFIGTYKYSDQDGAKGGEGFNQRFIRVYLDGTILNDFNYRIQMQVNGSSPHMKDFFVEWAHWKELKVKVGQFKRPFAFENPYNPWDVGLGDYSQLVRKLAGIGDYNGEASATGGRDQGVQLQGDLFPVGKDKHRFIHYQVGVFNGQGINTGDKNGRKDLIGTLQVQPVKDLFIGFFGWTGNFVGTTSKTGKTVTVDRNRWGVSAKYEHNGWSARAEYVHSEGHKISDYDHEDGSVSGTGEADAWYATVGVPCTPWMKTYLKYDAYRDQATWSNMRTMYCVAPNFQIHKNLMLQLQYNYVCEKNVGVEKCYNEVWVETYVRF